MATVPPPQIPIDPRGQALTQRPSLSPPPMPQVNQRQNLMASQMADASKGDSVWKKLAMLAPSAIGLGIGLLGKGNAQYFGAGMAGQGSRMLLDEVLQKRQLESEQEQNIIKNVHAQMEEIQRLDDPRAVEVVSLYNQALADGKLTAKEATKLMEQAMGLGDIKGMLGEKEGRQKLDFMQRQKEMEQRLEEAQLERTGVPFEVMPGQTRNLDPKTAAELIRAQRQSEETKRYHDAVIGNMQTDNALARQRFNMEQSDRELINSPEFVETSARLLGMGWTPGEVMNASRSKGFGPRLLAEVEKQAIIKLPPAQRAQVASVDTVVNWLNGIEQDVRAIQQADPIERAKRIYLLNQKINSQSARLSKAFGDAGQLSNVDIAKQIQALPGTITSNLDIAFDMLNQTRQGLLDGKRALIDNYSTVMRSNGGGGGQPNPFLTPPPTGNQNDPLNLGIGR